MILPLTIDLSRVGAQPRIYLFTRETSLGEVPVLPRLHAPSLRSLAGRLGCYAMRPKLCQDFLVAFDANLGKWVIRRALSEPESCDAFRE